MTENKKTTQKLSFEETFQRLDEISRQLENSSTSLEKSFELFEEGQKLFKLCHQILDQAEKRLKVITVQADNLQIEEQDFE